MNGIRISTYSAPRWDAKPIGTVEVRKDTQARYYVENVYVTDMRNVGLFTVVTCGDNARHNVLTAFLNLVNRTATIEQAIPGPELV